ncbi:hypothetical protein HFP15_00085 [Amycolatopsis sp. K13G38]|uniref:PE domain-containing protein n=1 Tax=Amycolatopsis acididurans TaxID=2724524 RepID=A0ABX1IZ10_9PSEU|nr:hypothetical protein [Amycolatopsis acididurans]NKQ51277.1 hypothetical protein [Amycolatopsis acididurans]
MSDEQQQQPPRARVLSGVELRKLASGGGFAVDENTGDRMIQALQGIIDSLETRWSALEQFRKSPMMGTSPSARWVSDLMVRTADDDRGLLTQLQAARDELPTYIDAIKQAKANYRRQDENTGSTLSTYDTQA